MRLYIVVPCANRKRLPVPLELRLRGTRERDLTTRVRDWCDRLEHYSGDKSTAVELYGGDHWTVARALPAMAGAVGLEAELWVISAGYGLVSDTALLHAYSATFARGHRDSVADIGASGQADAHNTAWWASLAEWSGPEPGRPRTLEALAKRDPQAGFLTLGSPNYIRAVEKDLLAASERLDDPARLVVVSSRGSAGGRLDRHLVTSDARIQQKLGGARVSLHARVARHLLEQTPTCGWNVDRLRSTHQRILAAVAEVHVNQRQRMTDDELRQFIAAELMKDPKGKSTGLLRRLRESGRACEQDRFKTLFTEALKKRHGA